MRRRDSDAGPLMYGEPPVFHSGFIGWSRDTRNSHNGGLIQTMGKGSQMAGQWINVDAADGSGSFRAYLAVPAAGKGPGLVLAQEIFGVNSTMQEAADAYAAQGYTVLVPDLFWRRSRAWSWATPRPTGNAPSATTRASTKPRAWTISRRR